MVKIKKKKRSNSDVLIAKKNKVEQKKLNPFEVHVNKEKFKILGRKCKHDRGLPGVSRSKSIKKRKQTLGKEYQELHKVNKFKDRRIGGGVPVDEDEIANARFTAEKIAQFKTKKSDIFNLNDDEILTHRGQTLEEIEQFHDPGSDTSEDEALDAEFTEAVHFGGDDGKVDRKALIEEKIIESKRKKAEAMKEKEEVHELTMKLDSDYKNVLSLIGKMKKSENENEEKPKPDDYDRALKEMIFEPRGEVTDKLQSEEEIAKKEKQRLEELERERRKRMLCEDENVDKSNKPKHKSADDLDDGYFLETTMDDEIEDGTLAYELEEDKKNIVNGAKEENEESESSDDESENENENMIQDNEDEVGEEEEESEEGEEGDNLDDFKQDESETEDESDKSVENPKESKENLTSKSANIQTDLPYTYDIPSNYESLKELLCQQTPDNQGIIIERTLKYNHPKLDPSNRGKTVQLFSFLLKYLDEVFSKSTEEEVKIAFEIFFKLSPHLYDLVNSNPTASQCILELIIAKYNEYKKNPKFFPGLNTLILFKLVSNLYSTSDFRHTIVTPCFIFISHILSRARIRTRRDLSFGLFIVTIYLEYTKLSKRILPAVYNYLLGILFLCFYKKPIEIFKIVPPFSSMDSLRNMLVLDKPIEIDLKEEPLKSIDLVAVEVNDVFKIRVLNTTLRLIQDSIENINENTGARYYAENFLNILKRLNISIYPEFVKKNYEKVLNTLDTVINKPLQRLVAPEKKPKCLRLMEPRIEKVVDDKRRPKLSKEKQERAILLHKIKRETKGAVREIRRDTAFITKMKIKKQVQSDLERKEKVRQIYAEAAVQQGELNALTRKRKKM